MIYEKAYRNTVSVYNPFFIYYSFFPKKYLHRSLPSSRHITSIPSPHRSILALSLSLFLSEASQRRGISSPTMAPPTTAAVEGGQRPQGRQQQQQGGFGQTITGVIRMAVFWYFASKFFSPKKPVEPSALMSNLFQKGEPLVYFLPFTSRSLHGALMI